MPITPGDVGSGTLSNLCSVSPSDQASMIDNLIDRIQALEDAVSRLSGSNIYVDQISDINQRFGWVYDVEYMGRPGWTQTPSGTLIPPTGFSFSSMGLLNYAGNPYQAGAWDSDGNLVLGIKTDGTLAGTKPDQWDAGGGEKDYYVYRLNDDISQGRGITFGSNTYSTGAGVYSGSARFTTSKEGLYLVNQSATWIFSGGTASNTLLAAKGDLQAGTPLPYILQWLTRNNEIEWLKTIYGETFQDPIGDLLHLNQSELFLLESGGRVTSSMEAYALPAANLPADIHFSRVNFSIVHLTTTV